jgi:hypothetical protein
MKTAIDTGQRRKQSSLAKRLTELPRFIRDLVGSPPRAGEGVNLYLYRVARVLHPYRSECEIADILRAATANCGRVVTEKEIRRAVENSKAAAWVPGEPLQPVLSPPWPALNVEQREAVIAATGVGLVDLWEMSPVRFEDNDSHCEETLDTLFPGNPLLCSGKSSFDFATRSREEWRGKLGDLQLIVPSPMSVRTGRTQDGKESEHSLENTGPRRFLVIEQDTGTVDEQGAILVHLAQRAPLALAVHSGSKSLHGWFFCAGQCEDTLRSFMRYAVTLGADRATWVRSQFVRMPDGTRDNGSRQVVYFFNPAVIK